MEYNVKVWRQKNAKAKGHFETYHVTDVEEDASFLEMLDILNSNSSARALNPLLSITIAVRVSAVPVPCMWTAVPMVRTML